MTQEQIQYAALDAWIALQIYDVLQAHKSVGEPLTSATPVGQLVSLYVRKQEVAHGTIVEQPTQFALSQAIHGAAPVTINVSSTKTRAVIQVNEVLAPGCVLPYHHQTLEEIQNGQSSFKVVVSLCALRT